MWSFSVFQFFIKADKARNLNKRTEFISKCRHENQYFLANIDLSRRVASYTQIRMCVLEVTRKFWSFILIVSIFNFYLYATKISLWKHHFD